MSVASVGRGDDEPFRLGGTDVRRGVVALVAIGDGADAGHALGTCSSSCGAELPHDIGDFTRRRAVVMAIAMVMVIGTSGSAGVDAGERSEVDHERGAQRRRDDGGRRRACAEPDAVAERSAVGPSIEGAHR